MRYTPSRVGAGLVVVDVQEKLVPYLAWREAFLAHLEFLIRVARLLQLPVLVTEQYPRGLGRTVDAVRGWLGEHRAIEKTAFSCCGEPEFLRELERLEVDQPIVCGIEAHVCVCQTALDLLASGRTVHLVSDAIASRHPHDREAAVELARRAGAIVTTAELVAFALFERAGSPEFKEMQKLVRAKDEALDAIAAGGPQAP